MLDQARRLYLSFAPALDHLEDTMLSGFFPMKKLFFDSFFPWKTPAP